MIGKFLFSALLASTLVPLAFPQTPRPRKPALIRDTDAAEGKEPAETPKETPAYDPLEAERCLQIGNYYFKQKNYSAAIQRYLQAIDHQPNMFKAYDALGKAYEKDRQFDKASDVYRDFVEKNPNVEQSAEFRSRLHKLEKR